MSQQILHIVQTQDLEAGLAAVCLPGLFAAFERHNLHSGLATDRNALLAQLGSAALVHIHGWKYELARWAADAAHRAGRPYLIAPHGTLTVGPYYRLGWRDRLRGLWQDRNRVRRAASIAAWNLFEERSLRQARAHRDIRLLPYGLNPADYVPADNTRRNAGVSPGRRLLLSLGPLDPVYGCVVLLKAFAELGPIGDGWNIALVGADPANWRRTLEAAVQRKGGQDRVQFATAQDLGEQRAWLARTSLVAAPALHVRPGVSIMQAVAAGVPVVATTVAVPPGLEDAVRLSGPSRQEFREALGSVLTASDAERSALAGRARAAVRAKLDWSVLADTWLRTYKELM